MQLILVINPGSTSTKLALFDNHKLLKDIVIRHNDVDLKTFHTITDQLDFRKRIILQFLKENNVEIKQLIAVVARGGLLKPIAGGTYLINQTMVNDLKSETYGSHASNLGGLLAHELVSNTNIPAFIVDPVVVDELADIARVSGSALINRKVIFHALNQKAVARKYAQSVNKSYEDLNLIVCHMGGGVTIGWHNHGKVVDVNDGLGGDGPFSPERAGGVPSFSLIDICYSNKFTKNDLKKQLVGKGGLYSYLQTSNVRDIEAQANNGDKKADFYLQAMCYQIAKEIGGLYFIANGKIDQLIITGGIAYSKLVMQYLEEYLKGIIPYTVYPGEDEMQALVDGALRVLNKEEQAKKY